MAAKTARRARPKRRWGRRLFGTVLGLGLLVIGGFALAVALVPLPDPNETASSEATVVYYADGVTEVGRVGESTRRSVTLEAIPEPVRQAVLAAEDREFYEHTGVSPVGIGRALINNVTGDSIQGASTITQQYAKNAYLTSERSWWRKARELILAVKLETITSKDDILSDYLNTIYFGRGAYGIEAASLAYFGTSVSNLDHSQGALLASVIKAPSVLDPAVDKRGARGRWAYVMDSMVELGWLTPAQRASATFPETIPPRTSNRLGGQVGYLIEAVKADLRDLGYTENEIEAGGLRIVSTFDVAAQRAAVDAIASVGPTEGTQGLRIGLAAVRPGTGEVIALYGGPDYVTSPINNATRAFAQGGSTFKPFALTAALEEGIGIETVFNGNSPLLVGDYNVRNYGDTSFGSVDLVSATARSVNTAYVELTNQLGVSRVADAAYRLGLPTDTPGGTPDSLDLTFVLGTASPSGADMAATYATFANRGQRVAATTLKEVYGPNGGLQYQHDPQPEQVISSGVADAVNAVLQQVVLSGTATGAQAVGRPVAGKTGTSNENRSMWFVGYTPQLSTAVLMAREDSQGLPISLDGLSGGAPAWGGGSYPVAMWSAFTSAALANLPVESFISTAPAPAPTPEPTPTEEPTPTDEASPEPTPEPTVEPAPQPSTPVTPTPNPIPTDDPPAPPPPPDPPDGILGDPQ
jgi:membrane peptidoglycan carboxypeptidase